METTLDWLEGRRIGYVPYRRDLSAPGDRRRIGRWAEVRGADLEVVAPGRRYDTIVVSARADLTTWAAKAGRGTPIVFDLIDSYLTLPTGPADLARGTGKWLLGQHRRLVPSYVRALRRMCERADIVVCSTPEQRDVLRRYARDVRAILDVHDELPFCSPASRPGSGAVRLFWEGLPENLRGFRPEFDQALRTVAAEIDIELHLVTDLTSHRWFGRLGRVNTASLARDLAVPVRIHEWSVDTLIAVATSCDIGVIPLDLGDALARSKPENKLAIMWRLGLPVAASATPAYRRAITATGYDLVCTTHHDWVHRLRQLAEDVALREESAAAGARYLRDHHDPAVLLARWDGVIQDALDLGHGGRTESDTLSHP